MTRFGDTTQTALQAAAAWVSQVAASVQASPDDVSLVREYTRARAHYEYEAAKAGLALAAANARAGGNDLHGQILEGALTDLKASGVKIQLPPASAPAQALSGLEFADFADFGNGGAETDALLSGQSLASGQRLISQGGGYAFNMQGDGNLVVYDSSGKVVKKVAGTSSSSAHLAMQSDGNLVVYDPSGKAVWATGTNGKTTNPVLVLQGDGNLVLYDGMPNWTGWEWSGAVLWASGTNRETFTETTFSDGALPTTLPGGAPFPDSAQPATMPADLLAKLPGLAAEDALKLIMQTYAGQARVNIPKDAYAILRSWAQAIHKNRLYGQTFLIPNYPGRAPQVPNDCQHSQWIIRSDDSNFNADYHNMMADFNRHDCTLNCITAIQQKDWGTFGIQGFHIEKIVAGLTTVAGEIVGSIVPGVGTSIGGAVGGLVGAAVQKSVGNGSNSPAQGQDSTSVASVVAQVQAIQVAQGQTTATPSSILAAVTSTSSTQGQVAQTTANLTNQVALAIAAVKAANPVTPVATSNTTTLAILGIAGLVVLSSVMKKEK